MEENRSLDKNQIIGFVIIGILIIAFSWYNSTIVEEQEAAKPAQTEEVQVEEPKEEIPELATELATDEENVVENADSLQSIFADKVYTLENDLMKIDFSGAGGQMLKVWLKEYNTYDSLPLHIIDNKSALYNFSIGGELSTKDLYYSAESTKTDSTQTLVLTSNSEAGEVSLWFKLYNGDYRMDAGIRGKSLDVSEGSQVDMVFGQDALRTEKNRTNELRTTTIYYYESTDDDYDYLSLTSDDEDEIENVKWVGHKQQFFSTIFTANNNFKKIKIGTAELPIEEYTKRMASVMTFEDKAGPDFNIDYSIYFGPNHYNTLKQYDEGYGKIIDFGWGIFGWISRFVVIPTFNWFDNFGMNYGLIIFIMALMIKLVLFPLTYQSYKSMAKMRVLKPEIDELNEKHKDDDPMKKQQATMALYKEAGVNPLGGCIPQLVQLPILIAMFRFFPASIELRQKSFLWADDLSTYDDLIRWTAEIPYISGWMDYHISLFTLLMTISTFIYTAMNQQMTGSNAQMPQMKYIMYGMPIMLFFWFNSYASGLSYYYLVANVITFTQQWLIRKTMDEDAIHAKLQANKKSPKKKSKFQQQLEEMSKNQGGRRALRQSKK